MIEQDLVEAYFESNGFLVRQIPLTTVGINAKKKLVALPVITVMNPRAVANDTQLDTRLFSADLSKIRSAKVATLGWANSSFLQPRYPTMLNYPSFTNWSWMPLV